jgi:aspartyl-tRNA(Asn)/glutamyl-tRNA(Gln) amidotransferase subunit A
MSQALAVDLAAAADAVRRREISSIELVEGCLQHISSWEPHIRALVAVFEDDVLSAARAADRQSVAGTFRGPLHGVPIVVKDLIAVAGKPTEAGSEALAGNIASEDAALVVRLRNADALIVGKSNTHEFAYGALTHPTRNPRNTDRMPGGSSGGSVAAVAAGEVSGAVGTDTAGSIREPAALCGVVGLKPTYGPVPTNGVVPLAWSLDTVGQLARTAGGCRLLIDAMTGADSRDAAIDVRRPVGKGANRSLRVGVVAELLDPLQPEVDVVFRHTLQALSDSGANVTEVRLGDPDEVVATVFVILASEASAYYRARLATAPHLFGDDVRSYLEMGMGLLAVDYVDAQRIRTVYRSAVARALDGNDYLLAPAHQVLAPFGEIETVEFPGGRTAPRDLTLIRPLSLFSLTGNPAVSVPVAFSEDGRPVGVQLISGAFMESGLLDAAEHIQDLMGWTPRLPAIPR